MKCAVEIGRAQGIEGERSFGTEGIYELGSIMPQEHVYNRYEGAFSVERFFIRKKALNYGDLKSMKLASLGEEVLKQDIITFEVVDKYTGELVRAYHGCSIVNYRETFRVNSIAGEHATFTYLYARDGSQNSNGEPAQ
jgi:hypothetical protein